MKAKLKSTGEIVDVLGASDGGTYYDVLYPYGRKAKSGHRADIRTVKKEKLIIIKETYGLNLKEKKQDESPV